MRSPNRDPDRWDTRDPGGAPADAAPELAATGWLVGPCLPVAVAKDAALGPPPTKTTSDGADCADVATSCADV